MKQGDLVFFNGQVVARVARDRDFPKGHELVFTWPARVGTGMRMWASDPASEVLMQRGVVRNIFDLGGVRHWAVSIYGDAPMEDWLLGSGLFEPHEMTPSETPAGMVRAIDLVLAELGSHVDFMTEGRLKSMRDYFQHRAKVA
jgi:hypothetical protein